MHPRTMEDAEMVPAIIRLLSDGSYGLSKKEARFGKIVCWRALLVQKSTAREAMSFDGSYAYAS